MIIVDEELSKLLQLVKSKSIELNCYISLDLVVGGNPDSGHDIEVSVYIGKEAGIYLKGAHEFKSVQEAIPFLVLLKGDGENDNEGL